MNKVRLQILFVIVWMVVSTAAINSYPVQAEAEMMQTTSSWADSNLEILGICGHQQLFSLIDWHGVPMTCPSYCAIRVMGNEAETAQMKK